MHIQDIKEAINSANRALPEEVRIDSLYIGYREESKEIESITPSFKFKNRTEPVKLEGNDAKE